MKRTVFLVAALFSMLVCCSTKTEKFVTDSGNGQDVEIIQIENSGNSGTGTLEIVINESAEKEITSMSDVMQNRTILPPIDMTRDTYRVTGSTSSGMSFKATTQLSSIQILGVPIGKWKIQVESINKDNICIGYGQGMIEVRESVTSEMLMTVVQFKGFGNFKMTVNWDAGFQKPVLSGSLAHNNGPSYDLHFTINGNSASAFVKNAAVGYYLLKLNLYNAEGDMPQYVGGSAEIIRVVEDETTEGVFNILANTNYGYGDINIGVIVDMNDPIGITLDGQTAFIYDNQAMTVQASSPGETENIEYTWYLNGEPVGTGNILATRSNLPAGSYRLDVIAFNDLGDRAGSVFYFFEVRIAPPSGFSYSENPATYIVDLPIQDNIAVITGAEITFCINPVLPEGLSMDVNTGTLSGTPVVSQDATIYTVTASNSSGSASVELSITINYIIPALAVSGVFYNHVDLNWTYSFPYVDGYELFRSEIPGEYDYNNPLTVINGANYFTDSSVAVIKTYYYVIRAFHGTKYSPDSNEIGITIPPAFIAYMRGWWKFDGNLTDSAGNNNGTAYGFPVPEYTTDVEGIPDSAIKFTAANWNFVDFGNSKFWINETNQFTIAFWLKVDGPIFRNIIQKGDDARPFKIYRYGTGSDNYIRWTIRTNYSHSTTSDGKLNTDVWYHVVVNYGNGYTKLFINGVLDKSVSLTGNLNLGGNNDYLNLGGEPWDDFSDISICDLRIFNYCLTDEDISVLYNIQ